MLCYVVKSNIMHTCTPYWSLTEFGYIFTLYYVLWRSLNTKPLKCNMKVWAYHRLHLSELYLPYTKVILSTISLFEMSQVQSTVYPSNWTRRLWVQINSHWQLSEDYGDFPHWLGTNFIVVHLPFCIINFCQNVIVLDICDSIQQYSDFVHRIFI